MSFGSRLKEARKTKKLTQIDVASKIGIDDTTISKYENDKSEPDNETLKKLSALYDVSIDYLMGRTADPNRYLSEEEEEKKEINTEAVNDLIDFLNDPKSKIYGNPIPQKFIDDILGYLNVNTPLATDKEKNKPQK